MTLGEDGTPLLEAPRLSALIPRRGADQRVGAPRRSPTDGDRSAVALAALRRARLPQGTLAVCILTGHGLKDAGVVDEASLPSAANVQAILEVLA